VKYKLCIIEDQRLLRKFCEAMDRHYGCKRAFGTSRDRYGSCVACPLATAEAAMYLMNLKGLPMGEAVKQTLRNPISGEEAFEILTAYARGREPYPDAEARSSGELKPNEIKAAISLRTRPEEDE